MWMTQLMIASAAGYSEIVKVESFDLLLKFLMTK